MTWTICKEMESRLNEQCLTDVGEVLCKSLVQAYMSGRVTSGVLECAKLLRSNPDNVMLCVLPEVSGQHDVTLDIQHTLIEAFCWENDISLIKVDSEEKLGKVLLRLEDENNNDVAATSCHSTDVSCLLIEFPKGDSSAEDNQLMENVAEIMKSNTYTKPVIDLPV